MQERRAAEAEAAVDRMTAAVAAGQAILQSEEARAEWNARHGIKPGNTGRQRDALMRLASFFPDAVKVN